MNPNKERRETEQAAAELIQEPGFGRIIGRSRAIISAIEKARRYALHDAPVVILGETGTGKELFARAIHYCGRHSRGPFVPVNCSAIPAELFENEFFGSVAGAFTGARGHAGLFEQSDGGTLFLDEIDSLPAQGQAKLLRALQERECRRLGATVACRFNVRTISASNQDLERVVNEGKFRQDLFFRLAVLTLEIPSLRERPEDIPLLANRCLNRLILQSEATERGLAGELDTLSVPTGFAPEAIGKLVAYPWPGNVRQLENVIERALALCTGPLVQSEDLDLGLGNSHFPGGCFKVEKKRANYEWEHQRLKELLIASHDSISSAAQACHTERRTFYQLLRKHGLVPHSRNDLHQGQALN